MGGCAGVFFPDTEKGDQIKKIYVGNTLAGVLKKKREINDAQRGDPRGWQTAQGKALVYRSGVCLQSTLTSLGKGSRRESAGARAVEVLLLERRMAGWAEGVNLCARKMSTQFYFS